MTHYGLLRLIYWLKIPPKVLYQNIYLSIYFLSIVETNDRY
ncbi:hypothetical protein YPPY34_3673 [Yersinia pestis PY-34]|nr:hypothetical protein YpAngola_A3295 [Yersinia pestis Angola]EDR34723.1 hypothetical protein YPIP275_3673 [Yersinia pestis biovar Orientalis str. IP275]EDR38669.1 hypothetical protein YpF1991016_3150 [Yersinia pestis biovar Orientalis str. F1991016]EDR42394.1 hypothetical protein YpE1979001_0071 [Yersinia pestis biovar Antiqua str. E1979001]EDR50304.1 hypothetical protein YpB42003004_3400 [Yersinia pestis biovar Antiqua str. B42003004]EDR56521.1 hypothetical protein YpMG051020_1176 [Yersinia